MLFRFRPRIHINECSTFDSWILLIFILFVAIRRKSFNNYRWWRQLWGEPDEEKKAVISRWARRKVSQFEEKYLDGRKSFIFSWYKNHREIHERALLHFFEPSKVGEKFDYHPPETSLPADTSIGIATAKENNRELNPQTEMTNSTPSNGPEYISLYPTDNVSVKLKFCSFTHYTRLG